VSKGRTVELGDRHGKDAVAPQRAIIQRVSLVAGLVQVAGAKGVGVDDQDAAGFQVLDVGLQRRRVHGHQRVEKVAGGVNVLAAEVNLEAGDAGEGAGGGADFRGEVGQRADVVAEDGGGIGEL